MRIDSLPFSTDSAQPDPSYTIIFSMIVPLEGQAQSEHFFLLGHRQNSSLCCFLSSLSLYFSFISNESSGLNQSRLLSSMIGVKSLLKGFNFSEISEVKLRMIVEMFNCIKISSVKSFNEISSCNFKIIFNVNMRCFSAEEWKDESSCENVSVVEVFLESQMSLNQGEDVSIENELCQIRQVLKLSGVCSSSSWTKSGDCLKVDDSIDIISRTDFQSCSSFNQVIFSSTSHLREIRGFQECISLSRIEIPSSGELIDYSGFHRCTSLKEIFFSSESHLRKIRGFYKCTSLSRIEIPS
jgi:hypothetical protein